MVSIRIFSTCHTSKFSTSGTMQRVITTFSRNMASLSQVRMISGDPGSGAGKGGGGGGSIRSAGGSFGKMEAAHEDQYFYNLQKKQFQKLKEDLHDEISFHEEQIKRHQEAINRHKKRITDMSRE
ncbi:PREDICTED: ATPase inhibitor mai-2, mitochondrial-like [Habropoda laboriosa]|uniref:ATPase inhibitor mai-2, mitochondrial-like n=1 Tax=Habropoda laboriosa TaxID=597456 RepID=UPI00083E2398|nr:PREDICTED: ATPase inhibitor mai-2, mitochondrial-like [Habropoda laboriosa]